MSKLVTIYGGSGFVGRYIARRMAQQGWRVRVATRDPNEALFVKPYGAVGQVEPVFCNIRDDASVAAVMDGADAVVNCVGILAESGRNTFQSIQAEGAARVARLAAENGVARLVQISAIGADADADSEYAQTKAAGEAAVLAVFPSAIILRPSIIFGSEDEFFNRFAGMTRFGPILPVVGADTKFPTSTALRSWAAQIAQCTSPRNSRKQFAARHAESAGSDGRGSARCAANIGLNSPPTASTPLHRSEERGASSAASPGATSSSPAATDASSTRMVSSELVAERTRLSTMAMTSGWIEYVVEATAAGLMSPSGATRHAMIQPVPFGTPSSPNRLIEAGSHINHATRWCPARPARAVSSFQFVIRLPQA